MYYYIYDDFVTSPKLQVQLSDIEAKLALLEIKGPVSKLHTLTSIKEVARRAVLRGATTIIVVGDDRTLLKMLNALPNKKTVIGLIPVGPQLTLAKRLNVENTRAGIEAAAGRKLVTINTGIINKRAFLQQVEITTGPFTAILDGSLTIKSNHQISELLIVNPQLTFDPERTSLLEARLAPLKGRWSLSKIKEEQISKLNFRRLTLKSQTPIQIIIDKTVTLEEKMVTIDLVENAARLIVGRERPEVKKESIESRTTVR